MFSFVHNLFYYIDNNKVEHKLNLNYNMTFTANIKVKGYNGIIITVGKHQLLIGKMILNVVPRGEVFSTTT